MDKLLIICGPTATGKTALGIKLAKKFNGEMVSADSRQVYRGMDIGTGKDLPVNPKLQILNPKQTPNSKLQTINYKIGFYEVNGIKLWLYDVVEPNYKFSVADYVECANLVLKNIWERGKLPIVAGGTGFYIKGLIDGIQALGVKPDWELRKKLSNYQISELSNLLAKIDLEKWQKMNQSDRKNPRRLVRAIEIALNLKSQISNGKTKSQISNPRRSNSFFIGLTAPYKTLYERIDKRVEERARQGIIKEIEGLLSRGYNWENSALGSTIGYKEWRGYLKDAEMQRRRDAKIRQVIQKWKYDEHSYARRQMTWFRKTLRQVSTPSSTRGAQGHWFDIGEKGWENRVENLVAHWYAAKN